MLRAAAELICERGFGETRIADVAKRAEASSALVIYYFGTRDRLLVDALRYSEQNFYDAAEKMLAEVTSLRERLSLLVRWTCVPENDGRRPRRLGSVVRPVGAGVPARRGQAGPGRTRRPVAQDDRRRGQGGHDGRGVVISGGTSGIGLACARRLHEEGARVWILGTSAETVGAALRELPDGVRGSVCDVSDEQAVEATVAEAGALFGQHRRRRLQRRDRRAGRERPRARRRHAAPGARRQRRRGCSCSPAPVPA